MLSLFSLAAPRTPRRLADDGSHDLAHGHGKALCGCEAAEEDHPFTIDCSAVSVIREATKTLESSTCDEGRTDTFEWGGSFATPDASYRPMTWTLVEPSSTACARSPTAAAM